MTFQQHDRFIIEADKLCRDVNPRRGKPYRHTCTKDIFELTAYAIAGRNAPFSGEDLARDIDAPTTQVFTALAFLKERGCIVESVSRLHKASSTLVFEDAMIEWHFLAGD
jgi:biotin operon repressor